MPAKQIREILSRLGWGFLGLIALRLFSGPTADAAFLLLAVYALMGRTQAVEALLLSFLFNNLNTDIFPAASSADIARYLVVVAAAISVFSRSRLLRKGRINHVSATVLLLTIFFVLHSIFFSPVPIISLLKSAIWGLAFLTLLQGWSDADLAAAQRIEFRTFFVLGACVIFSLLLMFETAAYVPRTTFLRGVLGHSQALGPVAATVAVYALIRAVSQPRPPFALLTLFGIAAITVFETNSRTALLATVVALAIIVAVSFLRRVGRQSSWSLPGLKSTSFLAASILTLGALFAGSFAIKDALTKRSGKDLEETSLVELYQDSRGGLATEMWANIESDPLLGIGFGLASNLEDMEITYFQGVPVGAVVEKGITILAVWEEVGLAGLLLFVFFLLQLFTRSLAAEPTKLGVFLVVILVNFGEATLLSAGGAGLIQLVLLSWLIVGKRMPERRPLQTRVIVPHDLAEQVV
jgi:hypothetical protein